MFYTCCRFSIDQVGILTDLIANMQHTLIHLLLRHWKCMDFGNAAGPSPELCPVRMGPYVLLHRVYCIRVDEHLVENYTSAHLCDHNCSFLGSHCIHAIIIGFVSDAHCAADIIGNRRGWLHGDPILSVILLQKRRACTPNWVFHSSCAACNIFCQQPGMADPETGSGRPNCPLAIVVLGRGIPKRGNRRDSIPHHPRRSCKSKVPHKARKESRSAPSAPTEIPCRLHSIRTWPQTTRNSPNDH